MTRRCELTGKGPLSGNIRSHAENSTRRVFRPNLVNVTLMSDTLGKKVRLKVCANGLKTVEHRGGLDASGAPVANATPPAILDVLRIVARKKSFWLMAFGAAASSVCGYGIAFW